MSLSPDQEGSGKSRKTGCLRPSMAPEKLAENHDAAKYTHSFRLVRDQQGCIDAQNGMALTRRSCHGLAFFQGSVNIEASAKKTQ